jgi:hypothetical protein
MTETLNQFHPRAVAESADFTRFERGLVADGTISGSSRPSSVWRQLGEFSAARLMGPKRAR